MKLESINKSISENSFLFIEECNCKFSEQVKSIAETIIKNRKDKPVVLLSGPSGSGKTTSALCIEKYLDNKGFESHTLSMDDWFLPLDEEGKRLLKNKKLDLESPARVDSELLNSQLTKIINCQEVKLPKFDFSENKRVESGKTLKRKPDEIVILEGIHALNPQVVRICDSETERLYISVRTRITSENGETVHPKKIRLIRRMLRDLSYRSRPIEDTVKMFESVQRGENRYIMPYKVRANMSFDTFIPYEIAVYKKMLSKYADILKDIPLISDVVRLLKESTELDEKAIPQDSLIREFIGGGEFSY